jgi:hypothetical protein
VVSPHFQIHSAVPAYVGQIFEKCTFRGKQGKI